MVGEKLKWYNDAMKVFIAGITGTGMGPLALFAKSAGFKVVGSDLNAGAIYDELKRAGIEMKIGEQDGEFLKKKLKGLDWFVYTSALPEDHPELVVAREAGIKCTKRDEFIQFLMDELDLEMIAVAGTHGKTTTTAMIVWTCLQLGLPISYMVGTTLGFAPSGAYDKKSEFFVYEADEYDRNFLRFHPWVSVITNISYDHPDVYKKPRDYRSAFLQFMAQSDLVIDGRDETLWSAGLDEYKLAGEVRRTDARLAAGAVFSMAPYIPSGKIIDTVSEFPGVGRRFERLADGLYSDYAHHPEEIAATIEIAKEQAEIDGKKGVVVVYEPHQNARQVELKKSYARAFVGAEKIFWLPTYLVREPEGVRILSAEELAAGLVNSDDVEIAELSRGLAVRLREYLSDGYLVVLMTAGPADAWMRRLAAGESVDELAK